MEFMNRVVTAKRRGGLMRRATPPKLLQPFVPTTAMTIEFITDLVFLVVMLVVLLGGIKIGCLGDISNNGTSERFVFFQCLL